MNRMVPLLRWSALLFLAAASPLAAQALGSGNGFLLGAPEGSFTLRVGYAGANAGGDVFDFTTQNLTLNRGDFGGLTFGGDLAFRVGDRTNLVFSGDYAGVSRGSEFRKWLDQNNNPITQTTDFRRVPLTATLQEYLVSPGRSIGRFAWVPTHIAPFVGVGGGWTYYKFHQAGDWVDFNTDSIFTAELETKGWAPTFHVLAGADMNLTPRLALTAQAKYTWAHARPNGDFASNSTVPGSGFDQMDLSGFATTVGLSVRY